MNAVEDAAYKASLSVTFQYTNSQAMANLYSGVTPILDTMKNVGAIEGYKVKVNPDINGEDYVNANTIICKIYLQINGVVNDVIVDLYALPPNADLNQFGE
jgi:phage tail sheath protein FI